MIQKIRLLLLLMHLIGGTQAAEVTIIINSLPSNTPPDDDIYMAGTINGWNPGHPDFILHPNQNGQPEISLTGTGTIEFKFTRGSWETVEGNENGGFLPNRSFTFGSADTLWVTVLSWEDLGGTGSTAAENVIIMDEAFYMPQLNRHRRIWLYLPPDYETSGKNYPVLYMHDGQNLFDLYTSFAGEWEVDETLNGFFDQGKEVPIVVGIDNGGAHRIDEYSPWQHQQYGGGEGDLYAQFIVETLKPFVDENYRTLPQREHTGVMGSSLGGLISHYTGLKHQDVFGKAGVFSPSFWFSDSSYIFAYETGKQHPMRYYMMGGTNESGGLIEQMHLMMDTLVAAGFGEDELHLEVVPGGQHNEDLWRTQFGAAYEWLFLEGASGTEILTSEQTFDFRLANRTLYVDFPADWEQNLQPELLIYSLKGQLVFKTRVHPANPILLPRQLKGVFIISLTTADIRINGKVFLQ
jgi:predicted alpha/beta superfamily hydrolase